MWIVHKYGKLFNTFIFVAHNGIYRHIGAPTRGMNSDAEINMLSWSSSLDSAKLASELLSVYSGNTVFMVYCAVDSEIWHLVAVSQEHVSGLTGYPNQSDSMQSDFRES